MNIKIGNTKIIDNIKNVDFNDSQIGDQMLFVDNSYRDIMINNEYIEKEIDEYIFYFINNLRYNNSLINLLRGKLTFDFFRSYEEDYPNDQLETSGIYNENEESESISLISINSKNFIYNGNIKLNDSFKYVIDSNTILEKIYKQINSHLLYKNTNDTFTFIKDDIKTYYHYLINDISNGLYVCFIIEYALNTKTQLFDSNKYCIICDKNYYFTIDNESFNNLFDFVIKNNNTNIFKQECENNIEKFKNKLKIFNYNSIDIIMDDFKRTQIISLMDYDLSYEDYCKQLLPLYENDKTNLKFYVIQKLNTFRNESICLVNGQSIMEYRLEKNDRIICQELFNYYKNYSPIVNVFNGSIINKNYSILYKDVEHMIIKSHNNTKYYKFLNGYTINIPNDIWNKECKNEIQQIKDKFNLIKKLEEEQNEK